MRVKAEWVILYISVQLSVSFHVIMVSVWPGTPVTVHKATEAIPVLKKSSVSNLFNYNITSNRVTVS